MLKILWRELPHLKLVVIIMAVITTFEARGNCHGGTSHYDRRSIISHLKNAFLNEKKVETMHE